MSVTRAAIAISTDISLANPAPFSGGARTAARVSESWPAGTASRQFDKASIYVYTIAALATQVIDLQTDLMQDGTALGLAELRYLSISVNEAATGNVTVEPDATDGWTALLQTGSVMNLAPGYQGTLVAPLAGSYAVTGSDKQLLFTNTDAANAATVTVIVAGTSV